MLNPSDFNIGNFAARIKYADPWEDFFRSRQALKKRHWNAEEAIGSFTCRTVSPSKPSKEKLAAFLPCRVPMIYKTGASPNSRRALT